MTELPDITGFGLIVWGIVICLLLVLITVIFLVIYSGILENVKVGAGKSKFASLTFAYKYAKGSYSDCGDNFDEILGKVPTGTRAIGIYYDDPRKTPSNETRYVVGAILAEGEEIVDEKMKENLQKEGYETFTIPAVEHCVFTTFCYTTQLSIYLATRRVYPALAHYIQKHRLCAHPMIEVYTRDKIEFFTPLSKQDDFYVPQVAPLEADAAAAREDSFDSGSHSDSSSASASERDESAVDSLSYATESADQASEMTESADLASEMTESADQASEMTETTSGTERIDVKTATTTAVKGTERTESIRTTVTETTDVTAETTDVTAGTTDVTAGTTDVTAETTDVTAETTDVRTDASDDHHTTAPATKDVTGESATTYIESGSKSEGSVTPDPVLTPSDTGSEQSGSSFEDLAAEARQIGKVEPTETDIQEIQDEGRATE